MSSPDIDKAIQTTNFRKGTVCLSDNEERDTSQVIVRGSLVRGSVFVCKLGGKIGEQELAVAARRFLDESNFHEAQITTVKIFKTKTGVSKGYGFIELDDDTACAALIAKESIKVGSRNVVVSKAVKRHSEEMICRIEHTEIAQERPDQYDQYDSPPAAANMGGPCQCRECTGDQGYPPLVSPVQSPLQRSLPPSPPQLLLQPRPPTSPMQQQFFYTPNGVSGMSPNMTGMSPNMNGMSPNMNGMTGMPPSMSGMSSAMAGMHGMTQGMQPAMTGLSPSNYLPGSSPLMSGVLQPTFLYPRPLLLSPFQQNFMRFHENPTFFYVRPI